jgi:5,10-methylenetetrahydromethanopterin reductase
MSMAGNRSSTSAGRTGLVLRDPLPWDDCVQVVKTAEETGYEAVFVPEISGREAFTTLTGFALSTSRIRLGTGVVTIRARSPVTTAMAAASVNDLSGGRFVLGVGSGTPARRPGSESLEVQGTLEPSNARRLRPPSTLDLVRRYVAIVRQAMAGQMVQGDDLFGGVGGFRLDLQSSSSPRPIWLGALGDRMISLAGEVADGVILNWCTPERVAAARRILHQAADQAGRPPQDVTVAVYVRACLGVEEPVALQALRSVTGRYATIPHYLRQLQAMGLGEEGAIAAKAFEADRRDEVPDRLVRALTVTGGRGEALGRFAAYRDAGADLVLCYPVPALDPFSSVMGTILAAAPSPAVER